MNRATTTAIVVGSTASAVLAGIGTYAGNSAKRSDDALGRIAGVGGAIAGVAGGLIGGGLLARSATSTGARLAARAFQVAVPAAAIGAVVLGSSKGSAEFKRNDSISIPQWVKREAPDYQRELGVAGQNSVLLRKAVEADLTRIARKHDSYAEHGVKPRDGQLNHHELEAIVKDVFES